MRVENVGVDFQALRVARVHDSPLCRSFPVFQGNRRLAVLGQGLPGSHSMLSQF